MSFLEKSISDHKPLYNFQSARDEANRCLYCYDAPCIQACPTEIDIPSFIRQIAHDDVNGAAQTIWDANPLGYSCARVCPVEVLCAGSCVYNHSGEAPIQIGRLQRFATQHAMSHVNAEQVFGKRVAEQARRIALVGGGPASITAAVLLASHGHSPTIFEKKSTLGGLNSLGIAPYKFQFDDAQHEIDWLLQIGIDVRCNVEVTSLDELLAEYDSVIVGTGLGPDTQLFSGEGVWGATEFIEAIKTDSELDLKNVTHACVIGGGNTAIDAAHELALLGISNVTLLYRKDLSTMSGYAHERMYAQQDGVQFRGDCQVANLRRVDERLSSLILGDGSEIRCELLVTAIGQTNPHKWDLKHPKVWPVGDLRYGGKEVVNAVADAKLVVTQMLESWN